MLSHPEIWVLHTAQRERGETTDSPSGTRWMTTFRKLPTMAPSSPTTTALTRLL